jgi:hypothetical protein
VDEPPDLDDLGLVFLDLLVDPLARFQVDAPDGRRQAGQDGQDGREQDEDTLFIHQPPRSLF